MKPTFHDPWQKPFGDIVGKGEKSGYHNVFPQCLLPYQ